MSRNRLSKKECCNRASGFSDYGKHSKPIYVNTNINAPKFVKREGTNYRNNSEHTAYLRMKEKENMELYKGGNLYPKNIYSFIGGYS
jgi:hypothetical protein